MDGKTVMISVGKLVDLMAKMHENDVIDLAYDRVIDSTEGIGWYGIIRADLRKLDNDTPVYLISSYGGCDYTSMVERVDGDDEFINSLWECLDDNDLIAEKLYASKKNDSVYIDEDHLEKYENRK